MSNDASPSAIQCSNSWALLCLNFIWSWRDEITHYFLFRRMKTLTVFSLSKAAAELWELSVLGEKLFGYLVFSEVVLATGLQGSFTLGCFVYTTLPRAGSKDFRWGRVNSMVITKWFSESTQSSAGNAKMSIFWELCFGLDDSDGELSSGGVNFELLWSLIGEEQSFLFLGVSWYKVHLVLWMRSKIATAAGPDSSVTLVLPGHMAPTAKWSWVPRTCTWWAFGAGRGGHAVNSCCFAQASAVCNSSYFFKQEHAGGRRTDKFVMELPAVQLSCLSISSWTWLKPRGFTDCRDLRDFRWINSIPQKLPFWVCFLIGICTALPIDL